MGTTTGTRVLCTQYLLRVAIWTYWPMSGNVFLSPVTYHLVLLCLARWWVLFGNVMSGGVMLELVLSCIVVLSLPYACQAVSLIVLLRNAMSRYVSFWTVLLWLILSCVVASCLRVSHPMIVFCHVKS